MLLGQLRLQALGGEGGHGMIALSPAAIERLAAYRPDRPLPKLFRLTRAGAPLGELLDGVTVNSPSMLAVEDALLALDWCLEVGGLPELVANGAGPDLASHRDAPPGLRIWGGPTVDTADIKLLLPWIDWAFAATLRDFR